MVLNSGVALLVADVSAHACQYIACNPERLSSDRVLRLIFCFPLQQLRRIFCFPLPPPSSPPYVSPTATAYTASHSD